MALNFDKDGFLIGEKRFKELNGNVSEIDNTTKEILQVLTEGFDLNKNDNIKERTHLDKLIQQVIQQKRLSDSIRQQLQYSQAKKNQNKPLNTTKKLEKKDTIKDFGKVKKIVTKEPISDQISQLKTTKRQKTEVQAHNLPGRNEKGQFISQKDSNLEQIADKITDVAQELSTTDTTGISPELDAINEIGEIVSPAGRALKAMGRGAGWLFKRKSKRDTLQPEEQSKYNKIEDAHNREERRLLRLILREIGDKSLWSMLASLLPFLKRKPEEPECCCDDDDDDDEGFDIDLDRRKNGRKGRFPRKPQTPETEKRQPTSTKKPNTKPKESKKSKLKDIFKGTGQLLKRGKGFFGPLAGIAGAVGAGIGLMDWKNMSVEDRGGAVGGAVGGVGGVVGGAALGATIGSVVPVVGTAVGGIVGGIVGGFAGDWLGDVLGRKIAPHTTGMMQKISDFGSYVQTELPIVLGNGIDRTKDGFFRAFDFVTQTSSGLWDFTKGVLDNALSFVFSTIDYIKNVTIIGINSFQNIINAGIDGISNLFSIAKNFVTSSATGLFNWIKDKVSNSSSGSDEENSNISGEGGTVTGSNYDSKKTAKENAINVASTWKLGGIGSLSEDETKRFVASVIATESAGGKLDATERATGAYIGKYQIGASWLADAGFINKGKLMQAKKGYKTDWDFAKSGQARKFLKDSSNWNNGLSYEKFMSSGELQDEAFKKGTENNLRILQKNGALAGKNNLQVAGLLKAAHIGGAGNAIKVAKGGEGAKDANGTSARKYYNDIVQNNDGIGGTNFSKTTANTPPTSIPKSLTGVPKSLAGSTSTYTQNTTNNSKDFYVFGDSIAFGITASQGSADFRNKGVVGQNLGGMGSRPILQMLENAAEKGQIQGRNIVISSGASNDLADKKNVNYDNIRKQIMVAKNAGASSVSLMGVSNTLKNANRKIGEVDVNEAQYSPVVNQELQKIAKELGVNFINWGSTQKGDLIHGSAKDYRNAMNSVGLTGKALMIEGAEQTSSAKWTPFKSRMKTIIPTRSVGNQNKNTAPTKKQESKPDIRKSLGGFGGNIKVPNKLGVSNVQKPQSPSGVVVNSSAMNAMLSANNKQHIQSNNPVDVSQNISDASLAYITNGGYSHNPYNNA